MGIGIVHVGKQWQGADTLAVPFRIRQTPRQCGHLLAIVFLRVHRAEMQSAANALLLERRHEVVTADTGLFNIKADNE